MKYLKLFESFFYEPIFYRFSHVDILNGKDELIYQPKQRRMIGPKDTNDSLIKLGFPDKRKCIHFMDSVAFDPSYKGLYGKNIYQIEVSEDSKLGWSFIIPINDWFYKGYPFTHNVLKNTITQNLLNSEYKDMSYDNGDLDDMRDILIDYGFIGTGTLNDLKMSSFFGKQPAFIWTNDSVKITPYIEKTRNSKSYKNEPLLTKNDFIDLDIPLEQIGNFYSSDWGKKIKRFQDSAPFELKRQEALNLLKNWRDSL
jgi:hypothetical protein